MQQWIFDRFVFVPEGSLPLQRGYAQLPTPLQLNENTFRFYFSSRDDAGRSRPFYIDYDMADGCIVDQATAPILELGEPGCFDDCGVMPSSVVSVGEEVYLYYIGWNQRRNISYQLAVGLAVSNDGGKTFKKFADGPILDRNIHDPIFCAAPCVHRKDNGYVMWYISCTGWPEYSGVPEPVYLIKRAESQDGIMWTTSSNVCIPYKYSGEALGRPWVIQQDNQYQMWYSSRGSSNYRQQGGQHYTIGYADSNNGIDWQRKDDELRFDTSQQLWDAEMQEYAAVFSYQNTLYMVYNGNTFGKSGFGLARYVNDNRG